MVLAEDVINQNRLILLKKGITLTDNIIQRFNKHEINEIFVKNDHNQTVINHSNVKKGTKYF